MILQNLCLLGRILILKDHDAHDALLDDGAITSIDVKGHKSELLTGNTSLEAREHVKGRRKEREHTGFSKTSNSGSGSSFFSSFFSIVCETAKV